MTDILFENRSLTFLPQYSLQFTRTGIDFSGSDLEKLSFEEWSDTAERLMFIEASIQWTVGDWLNMGERLYGEMYSQVMKASKLAYQTLANYKWVSSKVEFSCRQENLSYSHHHEVASLAAEEQIKWLQLAKENQWSKQTLRVKIELSRDRQLDIPLEALQMETPAVSESPVSVIQAIVAHIQDNPEQVTEILTAFAEVVNGENVTPQRVQKALAVLSGHTTNVHVSDDSYEWYTPLPILEAARTVLGGIDLDPASSETAQEAVKATRYFSLTEDGLTQEWKGSVWLNPPYNMPHIENFVGKLIAEYEAGRTTQAIILINNSSDTAYFQRLLSRFPACFTKGRLKFYNPQREQMQTRQGQTFFYLGDSPQVFSAVFSAFGTVVSAL